MSNTINVDDALKLIERAGKRKDKDKSSPSYDELLRGVSRVGGDVALIKASVGSLATSSDKLLTWSRVVAGLTTVLLVLTALLVADGCDSWQTSQSGHSGSSQEPEPGG